MTKILYCICSLSILLFAGCGQSNKKKLVIYSPHGKEMLGEFEKKFEALHPDVDVQWLDMGSQEVFDRIRTESQNSKADVWWGAPATIFVRAEKLNLLEPYKPTWANAVSTNSRSTGDFWYGTFSTPQVIAFNEKSLTAAQAPTDWNDLIQPQWKNKIVIRSPLASGGMRAIYSAIIARSLQQTGSEEQGWQWLKKFDENTASYAADPTQLYTKLSGADAAVTLWNMPDMLLQKNKYHYPFGYVFPKSGTVVVTDGIAIVKGTKNKELAQSFYEFVTNEENLSIQANKYYRIPSRTDIAKEKLPEWIRNAQYTPMETNWNLIAEHEAEWMKKWDEEIKGKK